MNNGVALLRLVGSILCVCLSTPIFAQRCTDITSFDFRNVDLDIAGPKLDSNLLDKRFPSGYNRPSGPTVLHMRTHEDPTKPTWWTARVFSDHTIYAQGVRALRVVEISKGNGGDGADRYVLVYGCRFGRLRRIFQFSGIGIESVRATDRILSIKQEIWRKQDSHCCPALKTTWAYTWDSAKDAFVLNRRARPGPMAR